MCEGLDVCMALGKAINQLGLDMLGFDSDA